MEIRRKININSERDAVNQIHNDLIEKKNQNQKKKRKKKKKKKKKKRKKVMRLTMCMTS